VYVFECVRKHLAGVHKHQAFARQKIDALNVSSTRIQKHKEGEKKTFEICAHVLIQKKNTIEKKLKKTPAADLPDCRKVTLLCPPAY
jgi:hypothetical protein